MSAARRSTGTPTRREAGLLLPLGVLTLVVLSTFTLLAYRNAVDLLLEERRAEADALARRLSGELEGPLPPATDDLERLLGPARSLAVVDAAGRVVRAAGERALGVEGNTVEGSAPLRLGGIPHTLRLELPAVALRSTERSLGVLTPVVILVDLAVTILLILYFHRLLAPFDRILRRARETGRLPASGDEIDFLIATFDEALETLSSPPGGELDALERTLGRSVESGVLLCDPEGRILTLNETGAGLLGVDRPAPGARLDELLEPHPRLRRTLAAAVREGRGVERGDYELDALERTGGQPRLLGLTFHALRREDGGLRGFLALFVDLTVLQRREEQRRLAASLAEVGELAAGVAHEMRNSLAALRGYLTLLERSAPAGGEAGEEAAEYVAEIRRETDHLKRVVDDFLSFARPGSARMESVDLAALLRRAADDPALAGVAVRIDAGEGPGPRVQGDAQLLERAFRNLLHNAAEAEREAGREGPVEVALAVGAGAVEIVFDDRGPGLPEDRERLFHPFVSHRAGGVGLGLALTQRILQLHRGEVELADRPEGGARATVRLPLGAIDTIGNTSATGRGDEPQRG